MLKSSPHINAIRTAVLFCGFLCAALFIYSCNSETYQNESFTKVNTKNKIPEQVDFIFHVKPILSDKCLK